MKDPMQVKHGTIDTRFLPRRGRAGRGFGNASWSTSP